MTVHNHTQVASRKQSIQHHIYVSRNVYSAHRQIVMLRSRLVASTSTAKNASKSLHSASFSEPTPLLLTGDEFQVSQSGIARSFYQLSANGGIGIEEQFDLKRARKTFHIHALGNSSTSTSNHCNYFQSSSIVPGLSVEKSPLASLSIDEMDTNAIVGAAGTGATTWEASIAMALYYSSVKPYVLSSDIIEVGCGVGGGSLLSCLAAHTVGYTRVANNVVLTDGNIHVLEQCKTNVRKFVDKMPRQFRISVERLKWGQSVTHLQPRYFDTVIACDCAYDYSSLEDLVCTLTELCHPTRGTIHIWGPYNRVALDPVRQLLKDKRYDVETETVELARFRLKPSDNKSTAEYVSKCSAKFLLMTAKRSWQNEDTTKASEDLD